MAKKTTNNEMKIKNRKIADLIRAEYNPRELTKEQHNQLSDSLKRFGLVDPIIVNTHKDRKNILVGGHQRMKVWEELGNDTIPTVEVNLSLEKEKELNVRLNKNTGQFDMELIQEHFETDDLIEWGFDADELEFFEPEVLEAEEDDYSVPDEIKTDIVLGDLIEIGEHRLLCGDSTCSDTVAKLMDGEKADIAFTSPPYNAGKSEMLSGNTHTTDNKYNEYNDNQTKDKYLELLNGFTNNALLFSDYLVCNIQSLSGNKIAVIEYLYQFKYNFIDVAIWDKGHGAPAMAENVMTSAWEYLIFISAKDKASRAIPNGNFRGTISNIYRGKPQRNNEFSHVHAATFPIDLPEWVLQFTKKENIILDQFLGTGTTMVAAHQLKRKCYGMELDPKYCQVIIDRMMKLDESLTVKINGKPYKK